MLELTGRLGITFDLMPHIGRGRRVPLRLWLRRTRGRRRHAPRPGSRKAPRALSFEIPHPTKFFHRNSPWFLPIAARYYRLPSRSRQAIRHTRRRRRSRRESPRSVARSRGHPEPPAGLCFRARGGRSVNERLERARIRLGRRRLPRGRRDVPGAGSVWTRSNAHSTSDL